MARTCVMALVNHLKDSPQRSLDTHKNFTPWWILRGPFDNFLHVITPLQCMATILTTIKSSFPPPLSMTVSLWDYTENVSGSLYGSVGSAKSGKDKHVKNAFNIFVQLSRNNVHVGIDHSSASTYHCELPSDTWPVHLSLQQYCWTAEKKQGLKLWIKSKQQSLMFNKTLQKAAPHQCYD